MDLAGHGALHQRNRWTVLVALAMPIAPALPASTPALLVAFALLLRGARVLLLRPRLWVWPRVLWPRLLLTLRVRTREGWYRPGHFVLGSQHLPAGSQNSQPLA